MRSNSRGFTLIEMVVAIVVTAILMAMAAPLIVHLVDGYEAGAQGADLATAVGPAVWRMQWDARNASVMAVKKKTCILTLTESNGAANVTYQYKGGQLLHNGALLLAYVQAPAGCPFGNTVNGVRLVPYSFIYVGSGSYGQLPVQGELSAYGY